MAGVEKLPMLADGYERLIAELKALTEERPLIVDAIEEARALAVHHTAELVLLHSTHGDEYVDPLTAHAAVVSLGATPQGRKALDDALAGLQKSGVKASLELSEERPLAAFVRRVQTYWELTAADVPEVATGGIAQLASEEHRPSNAGFSPTTVERERKYVLTALPPLPRRAPPAFISGFQLSKPGIVPPVSDQSVTT